MRIDKDVVNIINTNFIDLNELAYLYMLFLQEEWDLAIAPASINKLKRMGLLENESSISVVGENIVIECLGERPEPTKHPELQEIQNDLFEEFWKTYPSTDEFRHFPRTRQLRWNKQATKAEYIAALNRAKSAYDILRGLQAEIAFRNASQTENMFKYMKSSVNWLKHNGWEEYDVTETTNQHGKDLA